MSKELQAEFLFEVGPSEVGRLQAWCPQHWPVAADWLPTVTSFLASETAGKLGQFVSARLMAGVTIYPPQPFRALALTPLSDVRVVIVGQDPYHGPGQAEGLAFSVRTGMKLPPSLRNIYKELMRGTAVESSADPRAKAVPANGSLVHWACQGVLLLNTCLTVEDGSPASHANRGWEVFTDEIIKAVASHGAPVVFMLWGAHAQKLEPLIRQAACESHLVLMANHPSPLSALRPPHPFIGCNHFELANAFLKEHAKAPISWHNLGLT
jgi:uracil-DNA glycosylase